MVRSSRSEEGKKMKEYCSKNDFDLRSHVFVIRVEKDDISFLLKFKLIWSRQVKTSGYVFP